jgi:hypothetical protein
MPILADPDLYSRDPGRFGATTQALAMARNELTAAEEQGLTLEVLREEIDRVERSSRIADFRIGTGTGRFRLYQSLN